MIFYLRRKASIVDDRKWIRDCLSSVMVNAKPRELFEGSPLFVYFCRRRFIAPNSKGSLHLQFVSHLQFGDDTLIFGEFDAENWSRLLVVVEGFCGASGSENKQRKEQLFGYQFVRSGDRIYCLGVEVLGGSLANLLSWHAVRGQPEKTLFLGSRNFKSAKKRSFLSKGGKVTLISSVLAALPTYFMRG